MASLLYNVIVFAYALLLVGIGVYFYITKENNRLTDYMLGGRNVGKWPMAISDAASIQTSFVFLAWVGVGYSTGFFGLWYALGDAFVYLVLYRFLGPKFRRKSEELDSQTIIDHLSLEYENTNWGHRIRAIGIITVVIFLVSYISAQIIAIGDLASSTMGINYNIGIIGGALLVIVYVTLGGFNASVWSDLLQGLIAFSGTVILPIFMIREIGGIGSLVAQVNDIDPTLISATNGQGGVEFLVPALIYYGLALSLFGQPHGLMRLQSIRSERIISAASVITVFFLTLSMITPLIIGVAGRVIYPNIGDPETIALVALTDFFPPLVAGILAAGVLSIVLSTTDSMLLVVSADVTRFYEKVMSSDVSNKSLIARGRIVVVIVTALSTVIAYFDPATLFTIITFAFVGLGVSLGIPLVATLWWEKVTSRGVFAAILMGLVSTILNQIFFPTYFPLLAWPVTIATILIVSTFDENKSTISATANN